jgi:hypothetical protein
MKTSKTLRNQIFTLQFIFIVICTVVTTLQAQVYPVEEGEESAEPYHESALRRFEIVSLVSLPLSVLHSYLVVRGARMAMQGKIAPQISDTDYKIIGITAVSFSAFIGFWDWLHTHNKDTSQYLIPKEPKKPAKTSRELSYVETSSLELIVPLFQAKF